MNNLRAGATQIEITPPDSQFLCGYYYTERCSTGVHDPLWSSALFLSNDHPDSQAMFIANDILYISREIKENVRKRISDSTGIRPECIMITTTHTHSGPKTLDSLTHDNDPTVPPADSAYVDFFLDRMVESGIKAYEDARPARAGTAVADATGIGTNRRDPCGPADLEVPVLLVKGLDGENIACMQISSMHPTVLHEDSTLVSGDFPGMARLYLQKNVLGENCPVLHHTGPAGNQSPRHVTKGNTLEEAQRIGEILGRAVEDALSRIELSSDIEIQSRSVFLDDLPRQQFPSVEEAERKLEKSVEKLESLRKSDAPRPEVRTAECDWFGANNTLALAKAAADGRLKDAQESCLPAEIQIIRVGNDHFAGWPCEVFVEYALQVKKNCLNSYVIAYANGQLNGYIVTEEAYNEGGYEASSAQFGWQTGPLLVEKTQQLIEA